MDGGLTPGTHVLRHASTRYSKAYRVNGDPSVDVCLDEEGEASCAGFRAGAGWLASIRSCAVSQFTRTAQTARLLLDGWQVTPQVDARLNEVDYGVFESGPWLAYGDWLQRHGRHACPPAARESLHDTYQRLLDGLRACLELPPPRLVVTHGFAVSLLLQVRRHGHVGPLTLPGVSPLTALAFPDRELRRVIAAGLRGRS